jgi:hypothetical protein
VLRLPQLQVKQPVDDTAKATVNQVAPVQMERLGQKDMMAVEHQT